MKLWSACVALCLAASQVRSDCFIENLRNGQEIELFPTDDPTDNQYRLKLNENITSITVAREGDFQQIDIAGDMLGLKNMRDYHTKKESHPNIKTLYYSLKLQCNNETETQISDLKIKLKRLNVFPPELVGYQGNVINFNLPMPFPPINLALIQEVIVRDIDIYNNEVTAECDNMQVEVRRVASDALKKTFSLSLIPKVAITKPITFRMKISDKPHDVTLLQKSIDVTVSITKDESISLIAFEKNNYYADYELDQPLAFSEVVKINSENVKVQITGDGAECFEANNDKGQVTISGVKCRTLYDKSVVFLTLETLDETKATAGLTLTMISKHFEQDVYIADDREGQMTVDLKLLNATNDLEITVRPDVPRLDCNITNDCAGKVCAIRCTLNGLETEFAAYQVTAAKTDIPESEVSTTVLVHSPKSSAIAFSQSHYQGSVDDLGQIELRTGIRTTKNCTKMKLSLSNNMFTAACNGSNINIEVTKQFEPPAENVLVLNLTVKEAGVEGSTNIILEVKHRLELQMAFKQMIYEGTVSKDLNLSGLTPELINLPINDSHPALSIEGDYKDDFRFFWDQDQIGMEVIRDTPFPNDVNVVAFALTASSSGGDARTTIVLQIGHADEPEAKPIIFSNYTYTGKLKPGNNVISLKNGPIQITSGQEKITVSVDSEDPNQAKFGVQVVDEDKTFELVAKDGVDFSGEKMITVTLHASTSDGKSVGNAVIALEVIQNPVELIKFKDYEIAHTKSLTDVDDWDVVTMIATSEDAKDTIIYNLKVISNHLSQIIIGERDGKVVVKKDVPVGTHKCEITAIGSHSKFEAKTPLVIIILDQVTTPIVFSKLLYRGTLNAGDNKVKIDGGPIKILSGKQNITVSVAPDDSNKSQFIVQNLVQDREYAIVAADGANFTNFKSISLTLQASNGESTGYTVIHLEIIGTPDNEKNTITFEDYQVAHTKKEEAVDNWEVLRLSAVSTDKKDEITYKLTTKTPTVNEININEKDGKVVVMKGIAVGIHECVITATGSHSQLKASTPLVIAILGDEKIPISFSKLIYHGKLQTSDNKITLDDGPISILSGQQGITVVVDPNDPNADKVKVRVVVEDKDFELVAITGADFTSLKTISLSLQATNVESKGWAVVILEVEGNNEEEKNGITFKNYQVAHTKTEEDVDDWEVLQISAVSTDKKDEITYKLTTKTPSVNEIIITERDGKVVVKKGIPAGIHECVITAIGSHSQLKASTPLVIAILGDEKIPISFSKLIYHGKLQTSDNKITLDDGPISILSGQQGITVTIDPNDPNANKLKVQVVAEDKDFELVAITGADFTSLKTISFSLHATNVESKGCAVVILEVEGNNEEEKKGITFKNYQVAHTKKEEDVDDWEVLQISAVSTDKKDKLTYKLTTKTPSVNEIIITEKDGKVVVKKGIPAGIHECVITATGSHSQLKASTPLVIVILGDEKIPISFSKSIYHGKLQTSDNKITLDDGPISILSGQQGINVVVEPNDPNADKVKVRVVIEDKDFELVAITGADFTSLKMISLSLQATDGLSKGYTAITLEVEKDNTDDIRFEDYDIAHMKMVDDIHNWEVLQMVAISTNSQDQITYKLTVSTSVVNDVQIGERDGKVLVKRGIPVGTHECWITAIGSQSKVKKSAPLVLVVLRKVDNSILEKQADYSHVVRSIKEDQDGEQFVLRKPEHQDNYGYCIEKYVPEIPDIFISVEGDIKSKRIMREAPEFEAMQVPQFILTVQVMKQAEIPSDGKCPIDSVRRKRALIEGIAMESKHTPMSPKTTIVTVLIEDVNNNDPQMKPLGPIGYPNKDLIDYVRPPYLLRLQATDADSAESGFGKISYISLSPDQLEVNPDTGEVYPTRALYDDEVHEYEVQACDQGTPPRCTAQMQLRVHLLGTNQVVSITAERKIEKLEEFLEEVSTPGVRIQALTVDGIYENVPVTVSQPFRRYASKVDTSPRKRRLTAVIYALNEDNAPLAANEIKALFKNIVGVIASDLAISVGDAGDGGSSDSDTGLVVAVSVLAVLLVGVLTAGVCIYRRLRHSSIPDESCLLNASDSLSSMKDIEKHTDNQGFFSKETTLESTANSPEDTAYFSAAALSNPTATGENREGDLQKIEFVKHRGSNLSPNKKLERRATGYPLNPPLVDDIHEVMNGNKPKAKPKDDDLDSVITDPTGDTTKSVTFNKEIVHSQLFDDPHDSDDNK